MKDTKQNEGSYPFNHSELKDLRYDTLSRLIPLSSRRDI